MLIAVGPNDRGAAVTRPSYGNGGILSRMGLRAPQPCGLALGAKEGDLLPGRRSGCAPARARPDGAAARGVERGPGSSALAPRCRSSISRCSRRCGRFRSRSRGPFEISVQNLPQGRRVAPGPAAEPEEERAEQQESDAGDVTGAKDNGAEGDARRGRQPRDDRPESQHQPSQPSINSVSLHRRTPAGTPRSHGIRARASREGSGRSAAGAGRPRHSCRWACGDEGRNEIGRGDRGWQLPVGPFRGQPHVVGDTDLHALRGRLA